MVTFGLVPPEGRVLNLAASFLEEEGGDLQAFVQWLGEHCGLSLCDVATDEEVDAIMPLFGYEDRSVFVSALEGSQAWP